MADITHCPTCGGETVTLSGGEQITMDGSKKTEIDRLREQNRLHDIWHGELQTEIKRLRSAAARALERVEVEDSGEAEMILSQVVDLAGNPVKTEID